MAQSYSSSSIHFSATKGYQAVGATAFTSLFSANAQVPSDDGIRKARKSSSADCLVSAAAPSNTASASLGSKATCKKASCQQQLNSCGLETVNNAVSSIHESSSRDLLADFADDVFSVQSQTYRVDLDTNGERSVQYLEVNSNFDPKDFCWKNSSSESSFTDMNACFLKSLKVNPEVFNNENNSTPYEWSKIVLVAVYDGPDIAGNTNKSIWYSILNNTPFAIVWPSVRKKIANCFDTLQSRATKSSIIGECRPKGVMPVHPVQSVSFQIIATMNNFLKMPDKVRVPS
jgi:hypothetical protein